MTTAFVRRCGALAPLVVLSACTHSMEIKNLHAYSLAAKAQQPVSIKLKDGNGGLSGLFAPVHKALDTHPSVSQVLVSPTLKLVDAPPEPPTDVTATVSNSAKYGGSGWNFLITFPGFLIFTHAWNGFIYSADVTTDIEIVVPNSAPIKRQVITQYDLRHCDFGRGAAASSGWYLPGYGGTNILVGLFMMSYDEDATPEFVDAVDEAYGDFIANNIVEMISSAGAPQAFHQSAVCARRDRDTWVSCQTGS